MSKRPPFQLPAILSAETLDQNVYGPVCEECDCACPDDGFNFSLGSNQSQSRLKWPNLHSGELPDQHRLLFNPLRDNGVIVLNSIATEIWEHFKTPKSPVELPQSFNFDTEIWTNNMLNLGILEPVDSQIVVTKRAPRTLSAWVHVTNECNLRCDYCYINKTSEKMDSDVGYASIDAIIRSAIYGQFKHLKLKFSGGEATLNLDLVFQLDEYARGKASKADLEYESVVLSNGVALGKSAIRELIARNIRLMISLDGVGDAHDLQRKFINGKGSFAWVNRTLDNLAVLELKPFISVTVTDRNTEMLPDTVRYLLDRNLPFNINFFRDNECAIQLDDLRIQDDKIINSLQGAFSIIESKLPDFSLLGMLVDRSSFNQAHEKTCGVGESYMVVDHKGQVAKCHMEIEKPVTDVYVDNPLAFIRADSLGIQNLAVDQKEGCRDCEWKYWCTGGCPLLTYKATGRYDVKSPYCRIYKAIYPELLRLEGLRLMKIAYQAADGPVRVL